MTTEIDDFNRPASPVIYRIEVWRRRDREERAGEEFIAAAGQMGLRSIQSCQTAHLYFIQGDLPAPEVERLSREILADPVTEHFRIQQLPYKNSPPPPTSTNSQKHTIDVTLLPGVTDPAADNMVRAANLLGLKGLKRAATGQRFVLEGDLSQEQLQQLASGLCANPVVQRYSINKPIDPPFVPFQQADETVETIPLREATDQELKQISYRRRLALNLHEMRAIRSYYQDEGREPSDVELETLAQTWSEHCVHKTFRAAIRYRGPAGADPNGPAVEQEINGLLRTYIRAATEKVNRPWVRSAFVDNAGIVRFDDKWDLAFKVETHNHPSALEPFGGANTGVGGVIRDVLGVSARPIANTDILCFGPPDLPESALPEGVLHPRRIADGVIEGIEDYGNKMGIPTVNGAINYHPGYTANPLVYCGCLGLLPHGSHPTEARDGDMIIAIGGRTGRDGLRGATFSSMEMDVSTGDIAGSAVQIGNPIQEKQVLEVVLQARDEGLYTAITDCGAGGFSSAVGEMGSELGARVQLLDAPLKYPGLRPWEIWLSEAQERMVLAVPPVHWSRLQAICAGQDVEAVCIGTFEAGGRLRLFYGARQVGELDMEFLHDGIPQHQLEAEWSPPEAAEAVPQARYDLGQLLLNLLAEPNIRSKEDVIRRYDHEVQGGTAVKPLVGRDNHGPGDAAVLAPLGTYRGDEAGVRGVALGNGICPQYGELDPYAMAWAAVDEALRNVVAVGGDPDEVSILDNFCWGNPGLPDRLGSLVRCAQGCHDAAVAFNSPFISGKDSLNNEYTGADGQKHAIPGTLLVSAMALVPDTAQTVTMDLKRKGNLLFMVGNTREELGGSYFARLTGRTGGTPPQPVPLALEHYRALHQAIRQGLVQSCHDLSEGGLAVSLAEMCLAGRLGATVALGGMPSRVPLDDEVLLYAESLARFVVEVRPEDAAAFEEALEGVPTAEIGRIGGTALQIKGRDGGHILSLETAALEQAWRGAAVPDLTLETIETGESASFEMPAVHGSRPRVLVLHANGTNRDREAALACDTAGGQSEIVHVNQLLAGKKKLLDYQMLVVPGGFSYGDDLGAGTLWALDLHHRLEAAVHQFVDSGRPVLGICNGFQALVKSGFLPGRGSVPRRVTLAPNHSDRFECRWVYLRPNPQSQSIFTKGLEALIYCPVAHGEGRLAAQDEEAVAGLQQEGLIALSYVDASGKAASETANPYPANPNGSVLDIAGLCNPAGNVLGLMPHPEDYIFAWQHPGRHAGQSGLVGLPLFANGIAYARKV